MAIFVLLLGIAGFAPAATRAQPADPATPPLRLCADPDNLPFSSSAANGAPGLYIEIGELLGHRLGRGVEPVWTRTYFTKHELRGTMLAGKCDAMIGLPETPDFMGQRVIFTAPLLEVGYALVVPKAATIASLDDLKGRRVAVQFSSSPQNMLAAHDDIATVTVLSPEEAMKALASGRADAAIIWGPSAGWLNKTQMHDAYRVVPVTGEAMQWRAAIGLPKTETALRDALDRAIDNDRDAIRRLADKYGLPNAAPITLGAVHGGPVRRAG